MFTSPPPFLFLFTRPTVKHASDGSSDSKEGNKKKYTTTRHDSRTFLELIENRCPSYSMVAASIRGEMRLIVLALKDLTEEISDVYTAGENTGIAKVLANKVCVSLGTGSSMCACDGIQIPYFLFLSLYTGGDYCNLQPARHPSLFHDSSS
jgi:hypothetical protein